jgi:Arc/MetJ-type ribon-helix-helix transcriptional regulator
MGADAMRTISLKLPDALDTKLRAAARKRNINKSELVREALEAFFARGNGPEMLSCLDLAPDLAGSLDSGVGDLSFNKKHLEEFGRTTCSWRVAYFGS